MRSCIRTGRFSTMHAIARSIRWPSIAPGVSESSHRGLDMANTFPIVQGDSGEIGHLHSLTPSEVHVALAGTTANNTPFVVAWRVATQQRDSLRADEAHFLSSIRCH